MSRSMTMGYTCQYDFTAVTGRCGSGAASPGGPVALARRWWHSRGQYRPLRYWLLFRGIPVLVAFTMLFVANGFVIDWRNAYDVMLSITSPAATSSPGLAWPLSSQAGWSVLPWPARWSAT